MKTNQIVKNIETSFSGLIATAILYVHFSTVDTDLTYSQAFSLWSLERKEWFRYCDITVGKKTSKLEKPAGMQVTQHEAAKVLLIELKLWSDSLTIAARNKLVRDNLDKFENKKVLQIFKNSSVAMNMADHKNSIVEKKLKAGKKEKSDDLKTLISAIVNTMEKTNYADMKKKVLLVELSSIKDMLSECIG